VKIIKNLYLNIFNMLIKISKFFFCKSVKPISEDSIRLLLYSKDKKSLKKLFTVNNKKLLNNSDNLKTFIENNFHLLNVIANLNIFKFNDFANKLLLRNLIFTQTLLKNSDAKIFFLQLIAKSYYILKSKKIEIPFFKKVFEQLNKNDLTKLVNNLLDKLNNDDKYNETLNFLLFVSFLLKNDALENNEKLMNNFNKILLINSSYLMLSIKDSEVFKNYIILIENLYECNIDVEELLFFIVGSVELANINNVEVLYQLLKLFNKILKDMKFKEVDNFMFKYFMFVNFANRILNKENYINITNNYKKEKINPGVFINNYQALILGSINMILNTPYASDINYRKVYMNFIHDYCDLIAHLIQVEQNSNKLIYLTFVLSEMLKNHYDMAEFSNLAPFADIVLKLKDKREVLLQNLNYNHMKAYNISRQFQACIDNTYPYLNKYKSNISV
jgi:hypothetical protein